MKDIFTEIKQERKVQDQHWGGPEHDDQHNNYDWVAFITKHIGRAVMWPFKAAHFRKQMIIVAALAVAAIEWVDRITDKE